MEETLSGNQHDCYDFNHYLESIATFMPAPQLLGAAMIEVTHPILYLISLQDRPLERLITVAPLP